MTSGPSEGHCWPRLQNTILEYIKKHAKLVGFSLLLSTELLLKQVTDYLNFTSKKLQTFLIKMKGVSSKTPQCSFSREKQKQHRNKNNIFAPPN